MAAPTKSGPKTPSQVRFACSDESQAAAALQRVGEAFATRERRLAPARHRYYDTFDWRLYDAGGALSARSARGGTRLEWRRLDGRLLHTLERRKIPLTAREFPSGSFGRSIAPVLEMRRLLPRAEVTSRGRELAVLDGRRKTVARVRLLQRTVRAEDGAEEQPMPPSVVVTPVRGYVAEFAATLEQVEGVLDGVPRAGPELEQAMAALGRRPGDYSSKIRVALDPEEPAAAGKKTILAHLLATLQANEEGTLADLDSEFLHDFRVSVRRTRSALGQIKKVLPPNETDPFREEFRWLGRLTGPTRDLDVYLLKFDGYRRLLPEGIGDDLEPLRAHLEERQRQEQAKLARGLRSARYQRLMESWSGYLARPAEPEAAPRGAWPTLDVASRCIRRAHRKVLRRGAAIDSASPASHLHRLRIDCKKLRYLMEFFRSLYPEDRIAPLIRALKKLQDNLGDFNDYGVQQTMLRKLAQEMAAAGNAPAPTLMAMGRLVERLEEGEARERRQFAQRFGNFSAPATADEFGRLFRSRRKP